MIKKVLNGEILNMETKSISLASFILAGAYLISAFLGILRDHFLAKTFGAGDELDIYYTAFRIPDFITTVLIMGSISAAIVPIFSDYLTRSKNEAWEFLSNLINLFLFLLFIICFILFFLAPFIIAFIAPGFSSKKRELVVILTRIMFLSPIILGISNIISGVLSVFKRFLVIALAPIMYNIGIILGIVFLVPVFGIKGLAYGVILGALIHFLVQYPVIIKLGFRHKKIFNFLHQGFLKMLILTLPRTIGLIASQINLIVITAIGSTLISGSIAVINLANNIQNLPITFIAISFSSAIFPFLAVYFAKQDKKAFIEEFSLMFRQIIFLLIPISIIMFLLRAQIVRIVLGRGNFDWVDTRLTAACLGVFSFSILAYGLSIFISKVFYSMHNTKIPAIISVITVILNIIFCFLFIWLLSFENLFYSFWANFLKISDLKNIVLVGLPLAFSVAGIFQLFFYLLFLYKTIGDFKIKEILFSLKIVIISALIMAFSVYFSLKFFSLLFNMQNFLGVFIQGLFSGSIGIFIYIFTSFLLKSPEIKIFKSYLVKAISKING